MRPVLISQRVDIIAEYGERRDAIDQRWGALLRQVGLVPVPVPNLIDADGLDILLDLLSLAGVILSGGPSLVAYGGDTPERDATELAIIKAAERRHIPLLGVCRGLQVLMWHFGTTLSNLEGHVGTRHSLSVMGHGSFADQLRTIDQVNSYHEIGAYEVKRPLRVVARAGDGSIEAVEHVDRPIRGIMWHPEREAVARLADLKILSELFNVPKGTEPWQDRPAD